MENSPIINLGKLSFRYADQKECTILGIDLRITQGECVLITGESGSGKTTISKCINGLIPNFHPGELEGELAVNGMNLKDKPLHEIGEQVGSVFQDPRSQFFTTNTTDEVAFGCQNAGLPREVILERVDTAFEELEIEELRDRSIFKLSSGEKQKVAVASCYAMQPSIYLFDEPSANLDVPSTMQLAAIIRKLKNAGHTIVIIEHRLYYLKELADRLVLVTDGKIQREYGRDELRALQPEELERLGLRQLDVRQLTCANARGTPAKENHLEIDRVGFAYGRRCRNYPKGDCLDCKEYARCHNRHNRRHRRDEDRHERSGRIGVYDGLIRSVSFAASGGDIIAVTGKNGAGKTTMMKVLAGLLQAQTGHIAWNGAPTTPELRLKKSFFVMQDSDYQLFEDSVLNEVMLGLPGDEAAVKEQCMAVLGKLGLTQYAETHPAALSRGQKQRLTIACAMVKNADIIMFDEPTSGLDGKSMKLVVSIMEELAARGKVIIVISHDYEFLLAACTRVINLTDGQISDDFVLSPGTVDKLYRLMFSGKVAV